MNVLGTEGKIPRKGIISIDCKSMLSGEHYKGDFEVRRRTLEDEGRISQMLSTMTNNREIVDAAIRVKLTSIATLSIVIEKHPDWWEEVEEYADTGVIVHVFDEYCKWLIRPFRERQKAESKD